MSDYTFPRLSQLVRALRRTGKGPSRPTGRARRGLRPALEDLEGRQLLANFTVTNGADSNTPGTLRWAINTSNATPGRNTINFAIGNADEFIQVGSTGLGGLPAITQPTVLDATPPQAFPNQVIDLRWTGEGRPPTG